ncbi:hypothetical protein CHU92_10235 [Flavobacterium cyanobacteriorum]|uniref:Phenol meta deg superfamily protein n=1 Tax=Flavobacterium cyanobacteriorum TaxID=2022802 RepID=A0A255Z5A7_9FLAO|nr:transporter [Flavobacterium cyanobacteriorum]OYQ36094.1 hypothetical protein CHU92_10235 [Flavobacterium cyanobacteriorum]
MHTIKKSLAGMALLASTLTYSQYTDEINTNRPGESMGAFSVGKTIIQAEAGIYGIKEDHDVLNYKTRGIGFDLMLRYGAILEELEFIADIQYQFDQYEDALSVTNRNDFKQLILGAKYLIYDPDKNYNPKPNLLSWKANHKFNWRKLVPAVAVFAGANFPGNDNPYTFRNDKISPKVMAITQHHWEKWVWVNNFIYDKFTTEYPSIGYISTMTRGFNERWSGFIEFQGYSSDYYADGLGRIGAAWLLSSNMQVDASITSNLKNTPSILYGGIGFSWRFDDNYEEIFMPLEGSREEEFRQQAKQEKQKKKKLKEARRERIKKRKEAKAAAEQETPPTEE